MEAVVDKHEAARLAAVAPNLDLVPTRYHRHRNLAGNCRRSLFAATVPGPIGTIDVVVARDAGLDTKFLSEVTAQSLREQLLPAVTILTVCWISIRLF